MAKKPYIFVIFQGGGGPDPLSPPLDPHMFPTTGKKTNRGLVAQCS